MKQAKVSVLLIPGLGTMRELQSAYDCGARSVHVATHCTEADTSPQHIAFARKLGMDTTGFLMMAHLNTPEGLAQQGKLMESYGAQTVYITDSAGYMLPGDVKARSARLRDVLKPETEIGFHGHHNLGMGIANSIAAIEAGASRIDASVGGLGAGAGNTPLEVLCRRLRAHGHRNRGGPVQADGRGRRRDFADDGPRRARRPLDSLTLGFAGVYSTFLLHAKRAAQRFGVPARDILVELGRKKMIGGQEDMIIDTAMTMAKERGLLKDAATGAAS
ncbi:MAG: 4-hydroxy-2-oxovalerate aldolase [Candidatus Accumulibacter necessarius]|uniref:4-hydroxy-2-oxovalerate aldolase n=1 Tax=Candidatus Accumulibacter necessarius TaxID=2954386 RepID=UPI002FC3CDF1